MISLWLLQQLTKLLYGKTCIARDTTHGEGIDGIVPRNRNDARAVAHYDVLSLAHDSKASFLKRAHSVQVVDARDGRQG